MKWLSFGIAGVLMVLAVICSSASMANNSVATSNSFKQSSTRTIPELLPPECSSVTVTAYVLGAAGTADSEILMGTNGVDTMIGGKGNDCLMGGAGNDSMSGGMGIDVCFGGPGTDTFDASCETQIQ